MYVRHPLWLDATFEPKLRIEPMEPHSDRLSAHPEVSLREDHPILQATFRHEGLQLPQRCLLRSRKSAVPGNRKGERANQLWCGFSRFKWRIAAPGSPNRVSRGRAELRATVPSQQLIEHCLGILQERDVEPFGERTIDGGEDASGLGELALLA